MHPWHFFVVLLSGWVNREQQNVIDCLRTENQILKETRGTRRILLSNSQSRRLTIKARVLGRAALQEIGTVLSPDVILRWHRQLVESRRQETTIARILRRHGIEPAPEQVPRWIG